MRHERPEAIEDGPRMRCDGSLECLGLQWDRSLGESSMPEIVTIDAKDVEVGGQALDLTQEVLGRESPLF
jgi:hypothetical protein